MASKFLYEKEIRHNGLKKYKIVKAQSRYELDEKVKVLEAQWDEQWSKKCLAENKKAEKEKKLKNVEDCLAYSNKMTDEAEKIQKELDSILLNSLNLKPFDIKSMKNFSEYRIEKPEEPKQLNIPFEPKLTDEKYNPKVPFLIKLSKKKLEEFHNKNNQEFKNDWSRWEFNKKSIENKYAEEVKTYKDNLEKWEKGKENFKKLQAKNNDEVDKFIKEYKAGNSHAIEKYYSLVLENIKMPFEYDRQVEVEYNKDNKMIIVDILLPTIDDLPKLKKVTYVKIRNEFKESFQTESYMKKKYDMVIYQMVLQNLNYIFKSDKEHDFIESAVVNGKVSTIDKATGKSIEPYILTINISKQDFNELNLSAIDSKAWFKNAKGISAATFANITPVAPLVSMNREDSRFIEGYNVTSELDESVNLAAIDWQDFENLIREIFEQEFNVNGGEVKITQASRDGGVDAVAFDPDPIRGGKIVIQAKRYTNVVGVSAVRDLYGTVMNEGATKGILVTTSNYGNDAYNFANGKPLTLMNGANLLYLLEKHGHKARIDLKEAKDKLNS
ncbi:restriction endonuclease [Clostridium felsineum]|uniref:restriction endonuclease n=1 Tax=Clostridium felsineum TaxID=36839 RepID=UPI00214DA522|nr:restriction endonuclease [Clostridium felsineum]MCR3759386.1 restriction endonuclease [Clostridium felsineum]